MGVGRQDHRGGGSNQSIQVVVPLGTGAVSTQTNIVGSIPRDAIVLGIRYYGQAAVTGTSLVAECFARTLAGAAGLTLQASTTDIEFASAAAGKTGVAAALAAPANLRPAENQLVEVVFTASSVTAGPGDTLVEVEFAPRIR